MVQFEWGNINENWQKHSCITTMKYDASHCDDEHETTKELSGDGFNGHYWWPFKGIVHLNIIFSYMKVNKNVI